MKIDHLLIISKCNHVQVHDTSLCVQYDKLEEGLTTITDAMPMFLGMIIVRCYAS